MEVDTNLNIPSPVIEKSPIAIGVFYSDEFVNHESVQDDFYRERILKVKIGGANIAFFDYILSNAFSTVNHINHFPDNNGTTEELNLLIVPNLTNYNFNIFGTLWIEYEMKLFLSDGTSLKSYLLSTHHMYQKQYHNKLIGIEKRIEWRTKKAMRDLATVFFTDFFNKTDIENQLRIKIDQ